MLPRLRRQMTVVAVILSVCAVAVVGLGFGVGLPGIVSLGGGGLLIIMALLVIRYRKWLRRHPRGTDWQPSRGMRVTLVVMEVLTIGMRVAVIVLGSAVLVMAVDLAYRDVSDGHAGMLVLWIVVVLVVGRAVVRTVRSLQREWLRVVQSRSDVRVGAHGSR